LGGEITVCSEPDKGSTFSFVIPWREALPDVHDPPPRIAGYQGLRHICCGGHESRRPVESLHTARPTHSFFFRHSLLLFVSFYARREFPFRQPHRLVASDTAQYR